MSIIRNKIIRTPAHIRTFLEQLALSSMWYRLEPSTFTARNSSLYVHTSQCGYIRTHMCFEYDMQDTHVFWVWYTDKIISRSIASFSINTKQYFLNVYKEVCWILNCFTYEADAKAHGNLLNKGKQNILHRIQ